MWSDCMCTRHRVITGIPSLWLVVIQLFRAGNGWSCLDRAVTRHLIGLADSVGDTEQAYRYELYLPLTTYPYMQYIQTLDISAFCEGIRRSIHAQVHVWVIATYAVVYMLLCWLYNIGCGIFWDFSRVGRKNKWTILCSSVFFFYTPIWIKGQKN